MKLLRQHWKYAAIPTLVIAFLAIYPQLNLWTAKGSAWQGAYFVSNYDEVAYSAYVNALVNGKPRKYDPYLASETQNESLYSIQFIPAYAVAVPARLAGISTSSAFIILSLISASIAALVIFWLLFDITGDELLSGVGVILVCCLGTAVAFQGELRAWIEGRVLVDYLPVFRRYQPGFSFPLFFVFCGSVLRSLTAATRRRAVLYSILAGATFAILVFSYFYLWTAAAAWAACVYTFFLIWRRADLKNVFVNAGVLAAFACVALIPYFVLLSDRAPNVDDVQLLAATHAPNLGSPSMFVGLLVIAGIALFVLRRGLAINEPRVLLALSFAATPLLLFNQQVVTGRSLQPVHYEVFISNYMVLIAAVLFLSIVIGSMANEKQSPAVRRGLVYLAILAAGWGVVEVGGATRRNSVVADLRDLSVPALRQVQRDEQTKPAGVPTGVVLATNFVTSDFVPTVATVRPLWSSHTSSAGTLDTAENKRLFYCFLYYSGFNDKDLTDALRANSFEVTAAIFGSVRALPALGQTAQPITAQDINNEAHLYADFIKKFDRQMAGTPVLSYVITTADENRDFANLDRWYERDEGTDTGLFKVYKLKLRP